MTTEVSEPASSVGDADPTSTTKTAPPESPSSVWTRRVILLAFWAVIVVLGLPHWIWTTSIHRSNLPLESMNNWAQGKACQFQYPIHVQLDQSKVDLEDPSDLVTQLQTLLNERNASPLYRFFVSLRNVNETSSDRTSTSDASLSAEAPHDSSLLVTIQSDAEVDSMKASLRPWFPVLDIRYGHRQLAAPAILAPYIADEIYIAYTDEQHAMSHLLQANSVGATGLSHEKQAELLARNTRAFKYASTYHLTFSMFTASAAPSAWDVEEALEKYMQPLLNRLNKISDITVDTQVQLYASFSPSIAGPQYDSSAREWKLQNTDLSGFINAAEWPLSPGIGSGPTINFVLYIPSIEQTPLVLAETGGNSWLIPQWGGVQIFNPNNNQRQKLTSQDLRPVMLTFGDQLASLLGVPTNPPSLSLRISSVARERTTSLILSASSTLGALARLTLKLTSISIPDLVATSVNETLHRLDRSCSDLRAGRFESALENARIAETEAELAFFEPSMVGQVYFPDEHKVAVYVPLLGPMAVPLVMAGIKELRKLKERKPKLA